jgi:hypothetical protein
MPCAARSRSPRRLSCDVFVPCRRSLRDRLQANCCDPRSGSELLDTHWDRLQANCCDPRSGSELLDTHWDRLQANCCDPRSGSELLDTHSRFKIQRPPAGGRSNSQNSSSLPIHISAHRSDSNLPPCAPDKIRRRFQPPPKTQRPGRRTLPTRQSATRQAPR